MRKKEKSSSSLSPSKSRQHSSRPSQRLHQHSPFMNPRETKGAGEGYKLSLKSLPAVQYAADVEECVGPPEGAASPQVKRLRRQSSGGAVMKLRSLLISRGAPCKFSVAGVKFFLGLCCKNLRFVLW